MTLRPDELAFLNAQTDRCEWCEHLTLLHDDEDRVCCRLCDCDVARFRREHVGDHHNLVEFPGGGARGPHVGFGFAVQPPRLECTTCRTSIAILPRIIYDMPPPELPPHGDGCFELPDHDWQCAYPCPRRAALQKVLDDGAESLRRHIAALREIGS